MIEWIFEVSIVDVINILLFIAGYISAYVAWRRLLDDKKIITSPILYVRVQYPQILQPITLDKNETLQVAEPESVRIIQGTDLTVYIHNAGIYPLMLQHFEFFTKVGFLKRCTMSLDQKIKLGNAVSKLNEIRKQETLSVMMLNEITIGPGENSKLSLVTNLDTQYINNMNDIKKFIYVRFQNSACDNALIANAFPRKINNRTHISI